MTERIPINPGWNALNGHRPRTVEFPWDRHVLFLIWLLLTGCAEPPISQLNAATQALEDARISEAEHYAIERFTAAETALRQVQQKLDRQGDRMPLFRNYDPVITMLSEVVNNATQAKIEAIANKKESKANAEVALAFAKQHLQDVRALLADVSAPTPDHGELNQLLQAFQDTETLLTEIESIMAQEHFIDVMTTSHSVESFATRIQAQIISVKRLAAKQHI
ncbi:MAG: hypothetical protein H6750_20200 [Nitrospiraceae bacterium]|nr:hypothetical protein [Nitrospira sp.]MCB9776636.1 hypothetical protein [Nitrospiraceae bacterium]